MLTHAHFNDTDYTYFQGTLRDFDFDLIITLFDMMSLKTDATVQLKGK